MSERQPYDHAEITSRGQFVWSDDRLEQRYKDLEVTAKVPHNEERRASIRLEMACIAFEAVMREIDTRKRELEIEILEAMYNAPSEEGGERGKEVSEGH